MAKIRIVIEKGQVNHEVTEMTGEGCRDLTRPYVNALGVPDTQIEETVKPEMDQISDVEPDSL